MPRINQFRPRLEVLEARAVPATLQVNPADPTAFQTIQSAINAAQDGDTINVAHATYREDVVIDKGVSLIGQPDALHQNPFIVGSGGSGGFEAIVRVADNVSNVFIQNFAIGDSHGQQQEQVGMLVAPGANNVTLDHDVIRKIRDPLVAVPAPAITIGILVLPSAHNVLITHLALYEIHDSPGAHAAAGIVVDGADQVSIVHTYVKHVGDVGFLIKGAATNITLSEDAVEETESPSGRGIVVRDSAQVTLYHDKVYELAGTSMGLLIGESAQVTGAKDQLLENALGVLAEADFTGSLDLMDSNIEGNLVGIDNLSAVAVNATGDWWGSPSGPAPQGTGNDVLGEVDFSDWLTSAAVS